MVIKFYKKIGKFYTSSCPADIYQYGKQEKTKRVSITVISRFWVLWYILVYESADLIFSSEIMYFDVNRTKRNISVFHSDVEETLVTMRGTLTDKSGKKIKEAVAEESSSEISTSTLITDEGSDKINQQALSSAIKKTCESLINKVFFNKK